MEELRRLIRRILIEASADPAGFARTVPAPAFTPTTYPPGGKETVPAGRSREMQDAQGDWAGKDTRNPKAMPMSQRSIKVNAIRQELDRRGYAKTAQQAKDVTQKLGDWYDQLDPGDALVATASQLADRFSQEG